MICKSCNIDKDSSQFRKYRRSCKECNNKWAVEYHKKNKQKCYESNRRWRERNRDWQKNRDLKLKFGIDLSQYTEMLQKQDGVCAICHQEDPSFQLSVDHCHTTGKIRGLVCGNCNNKVLWTVENRRELIDRAIQYLEAFDK